MRVFMRATSWLPLVVSVWLLPVMVASASITLRVLDANGAALSGAVVMLESTDDKVDVEQTTAPREHHTMAQLDQAFVPTTLLVQTDDVVSFPNRDNVRHHVFSFSDPRVFEFELYGGDVSPEMDFPEPGLVVLGCNIHDDMAGYIVVAPPGPAGMTDAEGMVELELVRPTRLRIWHPWLLQDAASPKLVDVAPNSDEALVFTLQVSAPPERELSELERRFRRR